MEYINFCKAPKYQILLKSVWQLVACYISTEKYGQPNSTFFATAVMNASNNSYQWKYDTGKFHLSKRKIAHS